MAQPVKVIGVIVVGLREVELELERIVFADVWRIPAILKPVVEHTPTAANHQLGIYLVGKADAWRKVGVLRIAQSLSRT